ncbi:hypothetical protein ACFL1R_02225, partial [Candidatus Latescibacterota bacterium]
MATKEFPLEPQPVNQVHTLHRIILSPALPVEESLPVLRMLRDNEPFSMRGYKRCPSRSTGAPSTPNP